MSNVSLSPITANYISSGRAKSAFPDRGAFYIGCSEGMEVYRALLAFDVNGLFKDIDIDSALLKIYVKAVEGNKEDALITPHMLTSSWSEYRTTWENQPQYSIPLSGTAIEVYKEKWFYLDITEIVRAWIDGTADNFGILLKSGEESAGNLKKIYSHNNYYYRQYAPQLELRYTFKNPVYINSRNAVSVYEHYTAEGIYLFSKWMNCSIYSKYSFFVENMGSDAAEINVQISPDENAVITEKQGCVVEPGQTKMLEPMGFSFYCRLAFRSISFSGKTMLKIWFQAHV